MADAVAVPVINQIPVQPPSSFDFARPQLWSTWRKRFERYINVANLSSKSDRDKIDIFCYTLGEKSEEILTQVLPDLTNKTFVEGLKAFEDYFKPKKNVIFERFVFNSRSQRPGESVDEFITSLHKLAESCEYGILKDDLIRDRIVIGLAQAKTSERLQLISDLKLENAITIVRQAEQQLKQNKLIHKDEFAEIEVNQVVNKRPGGGSASKTVNFKGQHEDAGCPKCGLQFHKSQRCPATNTRCRNCKKMGHWDKVCRSSTVRFTEASHQSSQDENSSYDDDRNTYFLGHTGVEKPHDDEFTVEVSFIAFGTKSLFLVDTGAQVTCLSYDDIPGKHNHAIVKNKDIVNGPDGKPLDVVGIINLAVLIKEAEEEIKFYVIRNLKKNLLGRDAIRVFGLVSMVGNTEKHLSSSTVNIEREFPEVFRGLGAFKNELTIHIKDDAKPFCITTPRVVPIPYLDKLKVELQRMEKEGVIEPAKQPTAWCSPIVCVQKGDSIRLCCDYTELNKSVLRPVFPIPKVDNTLARLKGAKLFSRIDANSGFYQLKLDKESQPLTTFLTPFGRFTFKRLPFGINCAPDYFSGIFSEIFHNMPNVLIHVDDVLIFAQTAREHDLILREVLRRVKEQGITLNQQKCVIGVSEIEFLGHVISEQGVKILPSRVEAIREYPVPHNKETLMQFLGMVNFAAKYIPDRSNLLEPLNSLLKTNSSFLWDTPQQQSFEKVKALLSSAPILAHFDYSKEIWIQADASSFGLGYVLLQGTQDDRQLVAYGSRTLSETEKRYSQIEKEALALVSAAERFKDYITGISVTLETDHKPLLQCFQTTPLDNLTPRLQRLRIRIMRFNYKIKFSPGKSLVLADALSRNPMRTDRQGKEVHELENEVLAFVNATIRNLPARKDKLTEIQTEQKSDAICQTLARYCLTTWPTRANLPIEMRKYEPFKTNLSVSEGFLLYNNRLVIPRSLQQELLNKLHEGHLGITKCRDRAKQAIWWLGLSTQLKNLIENCPRCIEYRANPQQPFVNEEFPRKPWEKVSIDLFKQEKWYLIFTDYYSRFIEVFPLPHMQSHDVIEICKELFARMGIPEIVRTDNGPQFTGEFKEFARNYGFTHITSSPHFPQSNGGIEAAVKIAKNIIKKCDDVYLGLLAYRSTPLENGYSPAELLFSRKIRSQVPIVPTSMNRAVPNGIVQAKEKARKSKIGHNFNLRHRAQNLSDLQNGDMVWIIDLRVYGQVVQSAAEPRSYIVRTRNGIVRRNRWHLVPAPYKAPEFRNDEYGGVGFDEEIEIKDKQPAANNEQAGENLRLRETERMSPVPADPNGQDYREARIRRPPAWHKDYHMNQHQQAGS